MRLFFAESGFFFTFSKFSWRTYSTYSNHRASSDAEASSPSGATTKPSEVPEMLLLLLAIQLEEFGGLRRGRSHLALILLVETFIVTIVTGSTLR